MKKSIFKNMISLAILCLMLAPVFSLVALPAMAQDADDSLLWGNTKSEVGDAIGLGDEDPRVMTARIINVLLGFLGIIAVVIILLGGFKWMTAGGNEDKTAEARKLITAGIIGLIIILAAWAIARFVLDAIYTATTT
ncbi:MAG: hypothetical protein ABIG60_04065 [Patescibacteria group bacterium]